MALIKIPDHLEGKVKALMVLPFIVLALYMMNNKLPEFSCAEWAKYIKEKKGFKMIYNESSGNAKDITLYGIDIASKRKMEYNDNSGWIEHIVDTLKKEDTITKQKGEYCITVRRRNMAFLIPVVCGKVYTDTLKMLTTNRNKK